jgi:hypothetical protein
MMRFKQEMETYTTNDNDANESVELQMAPLLACLVREYPRCKADNGIG